MVKVAINMKRVDVEGTAQTSGFHLVLDLIT